MSGPIDLRIVDDVARAALALFEEVRPRTIVLSGGNTPRAFYELLPGVDAPWEATEVFFGDERCVPQDDPRSNAAMARRAFLDVVPATVSAIDGGACDADGYERSLRARFGPVPMFDLAVYGLGPDGHTASLFPGAPEVEELERWVVRVPVAGLEPFVPRVTMTVPVLSAARTGVFLVRGADKREALAKLLAGEDVPAARLSPERLVILADAAAVG